jgi:hypothetical protein
MLAFLYYNNTYYNYYKEVVHGIITLFFSIIYLYSRLFENIPLYPVGIGIESTEIKEYSQYNKEKSQYGPNFMISSESNNNISNIDKTSINRDESKLGQNSISELNKKVDIETNKIEDSNKKGIVEGKKENKKKINVVKLEEEKVKEKKKSKLISFFSNKQSISVEREKQGRGLGSSFIEKLKSKSSISNFKSIKSIEHEMHDNKFDIKENKNIQDTFEKGKNIETIEIGELNKIPNFSEVRSKDDIEGIPEGVIDNQLREILEKEEKKKLDINEKEITSNLLSDNKELNSFKGEEENVLSKEDNIEVESIFQKQKTWIDGLETYLARWEKEMEIKKSELKEEKTEFIIPIKQKEEEDFSELSKLEENSKLIKQKEIQENPTRLKPELYNLKSILKHSKFILKEESIDSSFINKKEINSNNELSETTKKNGMKELSIKKKRTFGSIRDMFNVFSKNKPEFIQNEPLKSKESKSFMSKIRPKFFKSAPRIFEQELLSKSNLKEIEEKNKVKWISDSVNIISENSTLNKKWKEEWNKKDYLMLSLLNNDISIQKGLNNKLDEIKLKNIKLKWKSFLEFSESDLLPKYTKQWMAIELIRPVPSIHYMPLTDFDLLIVPNSKMKSVLMPDGKLKYINKEEGLLLNSLKIELFDLIEKYPMGMKEDLRDSYFKNPKFNLYKDELSLNFKKKSELLLDKESNQIYKLKDGLSKMLLGQTLINQDIDKYGLKKESKYFNKYFDSRIPLKEPWSLILTKSKMIEKTNLDEYLLKSNIDRTLPFFKRLVPSTPEEYFKICSEMRDYKEKAEQVLKWNEWAVYQILETHKWNKDSLTREFIWYNNNYLPFYGPVPKDINWDNLLKNELDSFKEIHLAQEIILNKKLPLSWYVIENENVFWNKEYELFQKSHKIKMQEIKNELYKHLNIIYNKEKEEWFRVYDISRRILNNTYNWEWADRYNEIEEHFIKNNGYSYRERIWEYDRYLVQLEQGWMGFEKGKISEYKKRIVELELKWKKSANAIEKLRQDRKFLASNINKDLEENKIKKENLVLDFSKESNEKSMVIKEKSNQNEINKEEKKIPDISKLEKNTEDLKRILVNRLESKRTNSDIYNISEFKGKELEVSNKFKDKGKAPEIEKPIDKSNELLEIEEYLDKTELFDWVQTNQYPSRHNGWSTIPDDQIIPESSKDAERRAQKYLNFLREEKFREKVIGKSDNLDKELTGLNLYDPYIVSARKNKPITINSSDWKDTKLESTNIKTKRMDNLSLVNEKQNVLELDKKEIPKIHDKKQLRDVALNNEEISEVKNKKLLNIELKEEKKSNVELQKASLRKERKTHLTEVLSRGKEIPIYKYRGDDRFLDSDSEESVHEEKFNLYPHGYYLDPETNKITNKPKIIHDSYGSTLFSAPLPDPVIKTKTMIRTFLPPGHEWTLSSRIPSDFALLNDPMYITNSRYGPYGSERFVRNLLYNKEVSRFVDTDYKDGFISIWKYNDVTQCTYAILDQRIPRMLQEDIHKQNYDMDISRSRYLDNDQEWDITKKIDKNESEKKITQKVEYEEDSNIGINNNDKESYNSEEFKSPRWFKERTGEPRETVFIREGNTYLVARRNIEVDVKALNYLSNAVINMFGEAHARLVRPDVNMWAAWTNTVNSRQIATRNQVLEFLKGRNWDKMNFIEALQYGTLDIYIRAEKFGEINLEIGRDDQHVSRGSQAAKDYVIRLSTAKLIREEEMWLWKDNLKKLEKIAMPDEIESLKQKIANIERTHERVKYGLIRNNFIKERNLILPEELNKGNKPYSW